MANFSRRRRTLLRAAAAAAFATTRSVAAASRARVGQPAPPLTLQALDGSAISTSDLIGSVVILTFWATWCEPCHEELPLLSRYAERNAVRGLHVLGFTLDEPDALDSVRKVATTLSFPVGFLGGAYAGGYGRIWKLPASFTIDRAGRLVHDNWADESPVWTQSRLAQVVDPLLG